LLWLQRLVVENVLALLCKSRITLKVLKRRHVPMCNQRKDYQVAVFGLAVFTIVVQRDDSGWHFKTQSTQETIFILLLFDHPVMSRTLQCCIG
jgi:hypothetical protein